MPNVLDKTTGEVMKTQIKVANSKRSLEHTLFPGHQLLCPVKNLQQGACIVGRTFEKVTASAIGGECRATDSVSDLCPDVADERNNLLIESKAFGMNKSHRCARGLFEHGQLNNYLRQQDFQKVWYAIWNYAHPRPVGNAKPYPTEGDVVERVSSTLVNGYILDISIMERLKELEHKISGVIHRHCRLYFIGRQVIHRDYMVVYRSFLERLRQKPEETLREMGMDPVNYTWEEKTRLVSFVYDGVKFKTRRFPLFKLIRKPDEVPF